MNRKYYIEERALLNKRASARAYIVAIVEDTRDIERSGKGPAEIEFRLADCIEEIALEFDLSTRAERDNSVYKARRLAEIVNRFRDAVELEAREAEASEAIEPLLKAMTASA